MSFYETRDAIIAKTKDLKEAGKTLKSELKKLNQLYTDNGIKDDKWAGNTVLLFDFLKDLGNHSFTFENRQFRDKLEDLNRYDKYDVLGRLGMICFCNGLLYEVIRRLGSAGSIVPFDVVIGQKTAQKIKEAEDKFQCACEDFENLSIEMDNLFFKFYESLGIKP